MLRRTMGICLIVLLACGSPALAVPAKLVRHPDYHPSPSGGEGRIVFSYLGDLWQVKEDGSNPRRLTVHRARDIHPRFSPDGKWIAFSSNRYGNNDVFVMPAEGGKARQITFHSASDLVVGWSRDSKKVIFSSARGLLFPGIANLYEVPLAGGLEEPINTDWGFWGSYSPDGQKFAFNRHPMSWSRKHYRGSYAADLWMLDTRTSKFKRLVDDKLADEMKPNNLWPMYANGWIYFVSDRNVMAKAGEPKVMQSVNNIWKVYEEGGDPVQVTKHTSGALFWPSLASDNKTIVYEENFGLWKLDLATGKSKEIKVDIVSDDQENNNEIQTFNSEASSFDLSPSGKRAVVSVHGELFTIPTEKGEIRRLSQTPHVREIQPQWSPDGKWIAFVSDKSGSEEIWLCDERGENLKQITKGDSHKSQLSWSPDAKSLLYSASDNKLYRYSLDTSKTSVVAQGEVVSFGGMAISNPQWSPDGKWISFTRRDRTLLPHVYVVPAAGGQEQRITDPDNYSDAAALWTADGKRIVYVSGLDVSNIGQSGKSTAQLFSVSLLPETQDPGDKGIDSEEQARKAGVAAPAPKGKTEVKIDFERMGRRAKQLTRTADNIDGVALGPDARTVYFVTSGVEGGRPVQSIWSVGIDGDKLTRVLQSGQASEGEATGFGGFTSLQFSKDGKTLYYRQGKGIYAVSLGLAGLGGIKGAASGPVPRKLAFTTKVEIDRRAERRQVFLESWRVMKHRFYDPAMHGVDWLKVRKTYEPLLDHVADQEELHNVVSMMLGELNASHTGISGGFGKSESNPTFTRFPGFELKADKSGYYRIEHIYRHGPADKDYVKLNEGDYILAFEEKELKAGDSYWKAFAETPRNRWEFTVNSKPVEEGSWKIRISPISSLQHSNLQYEKWVADKNALVERLSGGEFGYLHIRQMNESSLRQFERDLARLHTKKALVIDQRFNPGGNIDQELLQILQQKQYQYTKLRGSIEVTRPLRGFFGPMVVMANERSTSDAEVFPDGFRTLKLGKVVGVTTYGAVIGTGAYSLMDGSVIRTPGSGLWNIKGVNLENYGVPPDVYVDNTPEDFLNRRDAQLEKAIEVLREELAKRK